MKKPLIAGVWLATLSNLAQAHPGHGLDSAYAGFMHPLSGWDHLLVMLAVGLWAGKLGGNARWQLPATFMLLMIAGAVLGLYGLTFSGVETAIAATVMAMGLLIAFSLPITPVLRIGLIGIFALMHGMAHGTELSNQGLQAMAGMMLATGLLHGLGVWLASLRFKAAQTVQTAAGCLMLLVGGYLLVAI